MKTEENFDLKAKRLFIYDKIVNMIATLLLSIILIFISYYIYQINVRIQNIDYNLYNYIQKK